MLSTYAAEIVDTDGAVAVDEEAMLADNNTINLENSDGSNTIYLFSEPISFTDENGNLKTKDISVEKQSDNKLKELGYTYPMVRMITELIFLRILIKVFLWNLTVVHIP